MSGDKIRNKKKIDQEYLDEILSMRNMGAVINKKIEVITIEK